MSRVYSIDFKFVKPEEAVVPVLDRSFLYGDSVYEVVRTYRGGTPFLADRHFDRLCRSAEAIRLHIPFTFGQLQNHINDGIREAAHGDSYIRIIVSRGTDYRFDLSIRSDLRPKTVIVFEPIPTFPPDYFEKGISVWVVSVRRNLRTAMDPNIKSGNYLNNVLALAEAREKGAIDAILLNSVDDVTEATTSNVFIVKNGVVITPDLESGILNGITRELLLEILAQNKIPVEVRKVSQAEFIAADEIFGTSTLKEVIPITTVDGKKVGNGQPGVTTQRLAQLTREEIERMLGR